MYLWVPRWLLFREKGKKRHSEKVTHKPKIAVFCIQTLHLVKYTHIMLLRYFLTRQLLLALLHGSARVPKWIIRNYYLYLWDNEPKILWFKERCSVHLLLIWSYFFCLFVLYITKDKANILLFIFFLYLDIWFIRRMDKNGRMFLQHRCNWSFWCCQ